MSIKGLFRYYHVGGTAYDVVFRSPEAGLYFTVVSGLSKDRAVWLQKQLNLQLPNSPYFAGFPPDPTALTSPTGETDPEESHPPDIKALGGG